MLLLVSCGKNKNENEYYVNLQSKEVASLSEGLKLENTFISNYDAINDLFITSKIYTNNVLAYGIASSNIEYVAPQYLQIIEIYGDYAIVSNIDNKIGVIKFKDGNKRIDKPIKLTDFTDNYSTQFTQLKFYGDYILASGEINGKLISSHKYKTVYSYKETNRLLENFKLEQDYNFNVVFVDNYICTYSDNNAYFYNLEDKIYVNGYLKPLQSHKYTAWNFDTDYNRKMNCFYISNGWFLLNPFIYTSKPTSSFDYNFTGYVDSDFCYIYSKCSFFNIITGESKSIGQISYVDNMVNKYNDELSKESYRYSNFQVLNNKLNRYEYDFPFIDTQKIIKNKYSICYFYFRPYLDNKEEEVRMFGEVTYAILDENCNAIEMKESLLPIIYQDNVGIITGDPNYALESYSANKVYDLEMNAKEIKIEGLDLIIVSANKYGYVVRKKQVATDTNLTEESKDATFEYEYGFVDNNLELKIDVSFMEMTPMSEGYLLATKLFNGKYRTYLFNSSFEMVEEIENVYLILDNIYVTKKESRNEKDEVITLVQIKKYNGEVLYEDTNIDVHSFVGYNYDNYISNNYLVITKDNTSTIKEVIYK